AARSADSLAVDAAVTARAATPELVEIVERAGPFGAGNPEPVFAFPSHAVMYVDPVGNAHLRVRLRSGDGGALNAIAFRALDRPLGRALLAARGQTMHLAGSLSIDRWQGQERVQLRLLDAAPAEPLAAQ
ncbi:MAG TPA: single-stranded-DNA-specific exonuclease RecJ, partial [Xanthobacteraceae bacterium]|nr:single-stranded-DNA-specific exonuclease RecJ [Xanthobacteraceae bacterium]